MKTTKTIVNKIKPILKGWDQNQDKGYYKKDWACCFGARIAGILLKKEYYREGENWFYEQFKKLGWEKGEVTRTMAVCGATIDPFNSAAWPLPAEEVLKNLLKYEKPARQKEFSAHFNKFGYDKNGYNKDGYNEDGYDRDGYDEDGYDEDGYDRNGDHYED